MTEAINNTRGPVAWVPREALELLRSGRNNSPTILTDGPSEFNDTPLYTAPPAAAVVIPEPMKRGEEGMGEYGAAMILGYNAFLREVARLNPAPDHSEHALGMVPADHVEHVRAMVVPEGWRGLLADSMRSLEELAFAGELELSCQKGVVISCACNECMTDRAINTIGNIRAMLAAPTPEPASARCGTCRGVGIIGHSLLCPECAAPEQPAKEVQ